MGTVIPVRTLRPQVGAALFCTAKEWVWVCCVVNNTMKCNTNYVLRTYINIRKNTYID